MHKTICPFLFETEVETITNEEAVDTHGAEPERVWMRAMIDWREVCMVREAAGREDQSIVTFTQGPSEVLILASYPVASDAWLRAQFTDVGRG